MWIQKNIAIPPRGRGFHLVTREVVSGCPELKNVRTGLCHLFLKHTSASLCLNENADPSVRRDFSSFFRKMVPDGAPYFLHTLEGEEDMSAHLKSALLGVSLLLPVREGRLVLGTWQGIYLGEHREERTCRSITVTIWGEPRSPGKEE